MATARKNEAPRSDLNVPNEDEASRGTLRENGEVPARLDPGSGEAETEDGLDGYQEAARHGAEDIPASERKKTLADIPVFDRANTERKI